MNDKLGKVTKVLARLAEIAHWIGAVGMLVGLVLVLTLGQRAVSVTPGGADVEAAVYGFELTLTGKAGAPDLAALYLFLPVGAVLMALMAMVFRNVYLILKRSEGATPFQPDNVRMVREIGWFLVAVPVVGLVTSVAARLVLGPQVEASASLSSLLVGLVVLCLSQVFARGMALESDVDGLL